ncbi:MAG: SAM-dependent methyltransferase [Anaerolineales bacterium]|nr:SAM-dependent methyltransferase [Anaerolineales bacterium]
MTADSSKTKPSKNKASSTAGYTCFSRACSTREKDPHMRGPDTMAEVFLPLFARVILNVPFLRKFFMKRIAPAGIYEYVIARTKLMDEVFIQALDDGFTSIVIMGAGMDTRAMRFRDRNQGTRMYELDIPKTQDPKRDILRKKGVPIPTELVYIPIDFNKQSLSQALFEAGYDREGKSLFLWEGVTMYLNAEAVDSTLRFISQNSAPGSLVAFDAIYGSVLRRENRYYGEKQIYDTVFKTGEGWTFGIEIDEIGTFMSDRGLALVSIHPTQDLEKRYLTGEDGKLLGRINGTHYVVVGSVI